MSTYVSPWMDEELSNLSRRGRALLSKPKWCRTMSTGESSSTSARTFGARPAKWPALHRHIRRLRRCRGDFRHEAILYEETARRGISGFGQGVHSICAHYLENHGTRNRSAASLPRMASGELIGAIGMSEPAAGSDLQGLRNARGARR